MALGLFQSVSEMLLRVLKAGNLTAIFQPIV
jgi:hypothetical protein